MAATNHTRLRSARAAAREKSDHRPNSGSSARYARNASVPVRAGVSAPDPHGPGVAPASTLHRQGRSTGASPETPAESSHFPKLDATRLQNELRRICESLERASALAGLAARAASPPHENYDLGFARGAAQIARLIDDQIDRLVALVGYEFKSSSSLYPSRYDPRFINSSARTGP